MEKMGASPSMAKPLLCPVGQRVLLANGRDLDETVIFF
jgi:hypothetical protein